MRAKSEKKRTQPRISRTLQRSGLCLYEGSESTRMVQDCAVAELDEKKHFVKTLGGQWRDSVCTSREYERMTTIRRLTDLWGEAARVSRLSQAPGRLAGTRPQHGWHLQKSIREAIRPEKHGRLSSSFRFRKRLSSDCRTLPPVHRSVDLLSRAPSLSGHARLSSHSGRTDASPWFSRGGPPD